MLRPKCVDALSANVYYFYENHPLNDPLWSGFVVSSRPGLIAYVRKLNGPQTTCELHYVIITAPLMNWSQRHRGGVESEVGYYEQAFSVYGPIGDLKFEVVSDLDSYYGFYQNVSLYCRGPFIDGSCQPPGYYRIGIPQGGAGNRYLFDTDNMRVEGIQNWNDPAPPYRFTIFDKDGLIYDRTEFDKPQIIYIECVGYCAPGGTRIGNCCVDCDGLTGSLQAIRQAVRRI